ncbi:MAG: 2OG-Fe(II) oxygenase [Pseudobacteriovorax sp.]|nr:2OG-Fe(II) oxygenase [Pseudobacteriovorax sp.]
MSFLWKTNTQMLSHDNLADLLANRCGTIQLNKFITPHQAETLVNALDQIRFKSYAYSFDEMDAPEALHIFDTHYLYEAKDITAYEQSTEESRRIYRELSEKIGFSVFDHLMQTLKEHWKGNIKIAREKSYDYFPCIARELNESVLLHADFAPYIAGTWAIQNIISELAWNIYLTKPKAGGECIVYDRQWIPTDDEHIVKNTYGYDAKIVRHSKSVIIAPEVGSLVLFNSRNFHEVKKAQGRRIAIGGHFGLLPHGDLIAWS